VERITQRIARLGVSLLLALLLAAQLPQVPARAALPFDANAAELQLFGLINQDRAQNGLPPLVNNPTLFSIARGAPHQVCGAGAVYHGRAQDMVERNYFSHQIPPCNLYVWPIVTAYGLSFTRAGENIGWNTYSPQTYSVDAMNTTLMNSPPHRDNILGDYNQVGVGAYAAPGPYYCCGGGPYNNVIMYTEIFIKAPAQAPGTPTNVVATPANGSATVSWTAPGNGGWPLTGYTVTPFINGVTAGAAINFGAGSTSVLLTGLTNGVSYTFTVSAANGIGPGPASAASNAVTPVASFPFTAASTGQYQLSNSDGATWTDLDATNLRLTVAPAASSTALLSANADLWTARAGLNQDLGVFVSANGGPDTLVGWKESGGFAGTFSPNAAFVQATYPMAAGSVYTVKLKWKTNIPAGSATIFAGAGPLGTAFSPTRLTVQLIAGNLSAAGSTQQYHLSNSDGATWTDIDASALALQLTPASDSIALLGANADLWTVYSGYNQDFGINVSGGAYGSGQIVAWKESGGFAGTFSPNAAFVQTSIPMAAGTPYTVKLQWKTNRSAPGESIYAGAGPIGGQFSPTRLIAQLLPAATAPFVSSGNQYRLQGSDGSTWTDMDPAGLSLTLSPSANCLAVLSGNSDLWTSVAGYNQDLGISVNGSVTAWKESGGFAGTFSPNAAFVQAVVAVNAGSTYTVKLAWKTNKPAGSAAIYAGAGPIGSRFSPTSLGAQLLC
jgi:uncharacterized protein YkwD